MTRIDFHTDIAEPIGYTCRLARKALAQRHRMVIFSRDALLMDTLDRELWAFSAADFLPHCFADHRLADVTPILLATEDRATAHHDVLINLDSEKPPFFSRFERMIEIVASAEPEREAGRVRWRFYRDRGYELTRHDGSGATA